MSDMKTTQNDSDVGAFLASVENRKRAAMAETVMAIMSRVTGKPPKMWGPTIIGYGRYHYTRADGSEHSFMITGLSPRKAALTIYIMPGFGKYADLLSRLGKFKNSVSCLYITRLENIDLDVLETLIAKSVADMKEIYQCDP